MVPTDTSDHGMSMGDHSVRLTRSSGTGGRPSWSATDVAQTVSTQRNNWLEVLELAPYSRLLQRTGALGVGALSQASRAASRGTLASSVPQAVKPDRFSPIFHDRLCAHGPDRLFLNQP